MSRLYIYVIGGIAKLWDWCFPSRPFVVVEFDGGTFGGTDDGGYIPYPESVKTLPHSAPCAT